MLIRLAIQGS